MRLPRVRRVSVRSWGMALLISFLPVTIACSAQPTGPRKATAEKNMAIDDTLFSQVTLNSRERTACSPADPGPNWRGIVIQAPRRAVHPASVSGDGPKGIPVCGLYTLDMGHLASSGPMMLIALDRSRGELFKGPVIDDDPSPDIPPPNAEPFDPARFAGMASGSYFNPDLSRYVKLPVRPALYEVYVEYAGSVSNRVSIEVVTQ